MVFSGRKRRSWPGICIGLAMLCCCGALAQTEQPIGENPGEESVPEWLVREAAQYYARQGWPECRILSITPYYAFDGTINAYAVQVAKKNGRVRSAKELPALLAQGQEAGRGLR